jgi:glycosyltransferase involved in cell wall biosynthesis
MISILITTYERPHQLLESLGSVATQDEGLIEEIILGDDSGKEIQQLNARIVAETSLNNEIRHLQRDQSLGTFPNIWDMAHQSRGKYILLLHDDDRLCPDALRTLHGSASAETDSEVRIWFGRNRIIDTTGAVDSQRTASDMAHYGKNGTACIQPMWYWALWQALPPNGYLIEREIFLQHMMGTRDGNVSDYRFAVRLANAGYKARFIDQDISDWRSQPISNTGGGVDVHFTYEAMRELRVPKEFLAQKKQRIQGLAPVATRRYLKSGDRKRALLCYLREWTFMQRLHPRGIATLCMFFLPDQFNKRLLRVGAKPLSESPK